MQTIDMRFDTTTIRSWIGKQFIKYKCDAFDYTNSVTQIVGLYIDDEVYSLTNIQDTVDYFGTPDDIAVAKIEKADESKIRSAFADVEMINTPIGEDIHTVTLLNERQTLSRNGEILYDVYLTRAIIINVGGREISFEKDTVPFSEEIIIRRGYNLIEQCSDESSFLEGWDTDVVPACQRDILVIQ